MPLWLVEAWPHEISKPTSLVHHIVCRANDTEFNLEDYCTMLAVIVIVYEVIYEARMHDIGTWEATSADIGPRLRSVSGLSLSLTGVAKAIPIPIAAFCGHRVGPGRASSQAA